MITLRVFEKGEIILKEDDSGEKAYSIEKGQVEVFLVRNGMEIPLHILGPGESVGEMSIIDDKPYSATVRAMEETTVKEIHRDDFMENLEPVSDFVKSILKGLFQRLRNANNLIASYEEALFQENKSAGGPITRDEPGGGEGEKTVSLVLEGETPEARESLSNQKREITSLPYRIGRKSSDPMANNHLSLPDNPPYHVSRHHVAIIKDGNRFGVLDSGSQLGTIVNGQKMGGKDGVAGPLYFNEGENTLVLGNKESKFNFKVIL